MYRSIATILQATDGPDERSEHPGAYDLASVGANRHRSGLSRGLAHRDAMPPWTISRISQGPDVTKVKFFQFSHTCPIRL